VRYRSDGLVTAIKQECLKMSFKTMFRITQHDFSRQTVPNDRCGVGERKSCEITDQTPPTHAGGHDLLCCPRKKLVGRLGSRVAYGLVPRQVLSYGGNRGL